MSGGPMAIHKATAARIRLVVLDVDGVMTDGGLYIGVVEGVNNVEMKRFHAEDGLGIRLLALAGVEVAIVSGRVSPATARRAAELDVRHVFMNASGNKVEIVEKLLAAEGLDWSQVAMLGDDLVDLPVLRKVGLPATVANGVPEVRQVAIWQSRRTGGKGAVREFVEALLGARDEWSRTVDEYCRERAG